MIDIEPTKITQLQRSTQMDHITYTSTERNNRIFDKTQTKSSTYILPSLLFIENGEHTIEIYKNQSGDDRNYVFINFY